MLKMLLEWVRTKIVVGNKIHDVTYEHPDPAVNNGITWPWSFSTAIASYSDNNTLVANNLISKSKTEMKTTVTLSGDKMTVPYIGIIGIVLTSIRSY